MDGCLDRWMDGWMVSWLDGWIVVWIDGWMVGWKDGWVSFQFLRATTKASIYHDCPSSRAYKYGTFCILQYTNV